MSSTDPAPRLDDLLLARRDHLPCARASYDLCRDDQNERDAEEGTDE